MTAFTPPIRREIPLTRGLVAIVDDMDYERVMAAGRWFADVSGRSTYAQRHIRRPDGTFTTQRLHNFITTWPFADHHNGDGLDNRRENLRQATSAQNNANTRLRLTSRSGFKGVSWSSRRNHWIGQICASGRRHYLGSFATAEAAARAYDAAARELFGEFAHVNFPETEVAS
jgi:hypothetical protein